MKVTLLALTLLATMNFSFAQDGSDDGESRARGQAIFEAQCTSCHGETGADFPTPSLHGQNANYIVKALNDFKSDLRNDNLMQFMPFMAKQLKEEDIVDLSNYISSLNSCDNKYPVDAMGGDIKRGEKIVTRSYCTVCHTEKVGAFGPKIQGQKTLFVKLTLEAFRARTRINENMWGLVSHFEDKDIADIAAYMNSLRNCPKN